MASFSFFSVTQHAQAPFAGASAVHFFRRILLDFPALQVLMDFPASGSHGGLFLPWYFEGAVNGRNESWGKKCVIFFYSILLKVIFTSIFCLKKEDQQSVPVPQEGIADIS